MAKDFVDRRGTEPNYLFNESKNEDFIDVWHDPNPYINEYGQNHLPVRKQKTGRRTRRKSHISLLCNG